LSLLKRTPHARLAPCAEFEFVDRAGREARADQVNGLTRKRRRAPYATLWPVLRFSRRFGLQAVKLRL